MPTVTPWLTADLGVRVGMYTDFHAVNSESLHILGRGLAVATVTEQFQIVLGVVYLDRVLVKILPAGGVIWTPNPDARWEFFFPTPKISKRWKTVRTTDLWCFIRGECGDWVRRSRFRRPGRLQRHSRDGRPGVVFANNGLHGMFDVGYVFDRALVYRSGDPSRFYPTGTFMLQAALAY